jgi:hypothetical protein
MYFTVPAILNTGAFSFSYFSCSEVSLRVDVGVLSDAAITYVAVLCYVPLFFAKLLITTQVKIKRYSVTRDISECIGTPQSIRYL